MKRIAGKSLVFFVFLILLLNVKISLAQRCDSGAQEILYFGPDYTNRIESVCVGYASTLSMSVQVQWFYEEDEMGYPNSGEYLQPITVKKPDGTTVIILTDANITSYGNPESVHVFPAGFFNQIGNWTFNYNVFDLCSGYSSTASYQLKVVGFTSNSISSNELICNSGGTPANIANAGLSSNSAYNLVWQNKVGAGSWANISGASSDSYSPPYINQTTLYRRIGTTTENSCQNISNEVTKTVYAAMAGGTIGGSQNSCYNVAPTQLSESVGSTGGAGSYSYKWNVSTDGTSYSEISGATSITHSPSFSQGTRYFKRTTTDATCGSALSNPVTLVGYADLSAGTIGSAQTICYNATPSLLSVTSSASGGNNSFTYNWQLSSDGSSFSDISGATSTSYQPGSLTSSTWYRLAVINTCGTVYTASVKITVYADMSAGTIGSEETICYNTAPSNLSVGTPASGGSGSYTYQWQVSSDGSSYNNITGANLDSYQPAAITANRWYRMGVVNTCATVYTVGVKKTVYADLSAGTIGSAQTICYSTTPSEIGVATSASGGNGSYTYQWQVSTDGSSFSDITGQFNTTYQPGALTSDRWYRLEVFNICGTVFTSSVKVTVRGQFMVGSISSDQSICNGTTPTIISVSTPASGGNGSYTYQWQSSTDGSSYGDVSGANATSYQPSTLTSSTWYKLKVTDLCGTLTTSSVKKTVYSTVSAGTITGEQTICYNTVPLQFNTNTAPSGGDGSFTYQWQISTDGSVFNDISGATLNSYQASALTASRWYRLKIINLCSTVNTNTIKVTVYNQFASGSIGNDQSICYNTIPALLNTTTSASGGSGSYNYQWKYSDDGTNFYNVSGANSTSYQPSTLTISRWYKLEVTNSCEVKLTNTIKVTTYSQLSVGTTTGTQTICYNSTPTQLTVGTSPSGGSGVYTYQWEVSDNGSNWSSISGATGISYQPASLSSTTYYRRNVINVCSSDYANTLTVTVRANLVPGIINGGQTVCNNTAPTTFTTNVLPSGGTGSFTYQWQSSPNGSSWTNISGATSEMYSASALTTTTYFRRAETSGTCGTVYTNSIQVFVNPLLVAGTVKSNETICYNTVPSMFITDTYPTGGTGSYSYQWQKLVASSWTNISGATGETYTSGALAETSYFRRLETSGSCGTVNTSQINIAVYAEFLPGVVGTNQTINYNTIPAEIEVIQAASGGTGVFTYQWQKSLDNSVWSNITDANGQNYQPTALTVNSYFKRLTASSTCGSKSANTVLITVYPQLVAGTVKSDQTICYNSVPSTFVTNTLPTGGTGFYNYQWQKLVGSTWTNISGATGDTYTTAALTETSYFRRAETSGTNPTVYTNTIQVTVRPQIVAGSIKSDQIICYGSAPSLLLTNTYPSGGDGTFTYKWQKLVSSTWTDISSATSESYDPGVLNATTYFRRVETNGTCGSVSSNQITIQVYAQFVPGVIGSSQTVSYNAVPSEIVTIQSPTGATGTYSYQWQRSIDNTIWSNITSATSENYQSTALTASTYFKRITTSGSCGSVSSNIILVTVNPQLIAGSIQQNQTICYNAVPSTFTTNTLPTGGTGYYNYQWQKLAGSTWTDIVGASGETYTSGALTETSFFRRAETSGSSGTVFTNSVTITVNNALVAGTIKSDQVICYGAVPSILLTNTLPNGGTGSYSFQWQKLIGSSWTDILGATGESYLPDALNSSAIFRRVETSGSCGSVTSNQINITVYGQFTPGVIGSSQTINYNTAPSEIVSLQSPSGATGVYGYQWQKSIDNSTWSNVAGANSETYQPPVITTKTYYKRQITSGSCGTIESNVVTIAVNSQLTPGTVEGTQSICYNAVPSILNTSASPSGGNGVYLYQWLKSEDGSSWIDVVAATNETYQPSALIKTTYYKKRVTSESNIVYTNIVTVTVYEALSSGQIGVDQTVCYNTAPSSLFTVTQPSGGSGTYTNQWMASSNGTIFVDIAGATNGFYEPSALTTKTFYKKVVTNLCGVKESNVVAVSVYGVFSAGTIGANQTILYGSTPQRLEVSVLPTGGTGSFSYQWQSSTDNSIWTNISGATNSDYAPGSLSQTIYYKRLTTSGGCGTLETNVVVVTVTNEALVGSIGSDQAICYNTSPNLLTTISQPSAGTVVNSKIWQKSDDGLVWTDIVAAANDTYQPPSLTITVYYRKKMVTASSGTIYTNIVTITVNPEFSTGTIGINQTVCNGYPSSPITTIVAPVGTSVQYLWQESLNNASWTDIAEATNDYYDPGTLTTTKYFRKKVMSSCGVGYTESVKISIGESLQGGIIESDQSVAFNTIPAKLIGSVAIGGSGAYVYQWYSSINSSDWQIVITGGVDKDYQPGALTQKTYFKRSVTSGACGVQYSNVVAVSVFDGLIPGVVGEAQSICYNSSPDLLTGTSPSGGSGQYSYQWQYSLQGTTWVDIIGEVGISYKPSSLTINTYFRRVTISGNTQANSNFIMIRVYDQIALPVTSLKASYCKNTRVNIDVANPAYLSYKWYDANKNYLLDGSRYSVDNFNDSKTIYVRSVSSNGCLSDYLEQIITPDNLKAGFTLDISQVTVGGSVRFTNSSVNANSYKWNFYDGDLIFEQNPTHYYNSTDGLDSKSFNVKLNVLSVNGCKDSLLVANAVKVINTLTGIDPDATITPSYYPNPVNDNLTIHCSSRITKIRVFSIIGNLLESSTPNSQSVTIPFSSKKSGVYIIEVIEANGAKSNLKVIKQ
ncbi:MAG: T9SS type A sorting domain-containing protein [Tenuifilaceae bacterium]